MSNVAPIGTGYAGEPVVFICTISDPVERYSSACLLTGEGRHPLCDGWGADGDPCECPCHPVKRAETPGCDLCAERIYLDDLFDGKRRPHGVTLCRKHIGEWIDRDREPGSS